MSSTQTTPAHGPWPPGDRPDVDPDPAADEPGGQYPATTPRALTLAVSLVLTALLLTVASLLPVPYAVSSPGPTRDTLGEVDGAPLITVDGVPVHESSGQLLLTTVAVTGGPGYPVTLPRLVRGWLDRARAVRPVEEVFVPTETQEQIDARNQALMVSSQETATVAALEELGHRVPSVLTIAGAVEGTGAYGVVREGDVLVALDGEQLEGFPELTERMAEVEPGATVSLGVLRDDERHDLDVVTTPDGEGGALLGVYINPEFDLPVDVSIAIENIGGPSAGMMFALGIIDMLTEEDETGGATIAGTGTVDLSGGVGQIGGIRQKLVGAARDGASWFLAPAVNCDQVVGYEPEGLQVVRVSTLAEARDAVTRIGRGDGEGLPGCS